jgi:hypothetical protein
MDVVGPKNEIGITAEKNSYLKKHTEFVKSALVSKQI